MSVMVGKNGALAVGSVLLFLVVVIMSAGTLPDYKAKATEVGTEHKIIGSKLSGNRMIFEVDPVESLYELTAYADLIVVGTVRTEGETLKAVGPSDASAPVVEQNLTSMEVAIDEVVYGQAEADVINYVQLGTVGDDHEQTKVHKGDKVLLILQKADGENTYASVALEEGVFYVVDGDKVVSQSDNQVLSAYDGKMLKMLVDDLKISSAQ